MNEEEKAKLIARYIKGYKKAMAKPLNGLELETIRNDLEKIEDQIHPKLWSFIARSYNAALSSSDTPMEATKFGDPYENDMIVYQDDL